MTARKTSSQVIRLIAILCAAVQVCNLPVVNAEELPDTFIWAWDRAEDLRWLDSKKIGIAFLAATINLSDYGVRTKPRQVQLLLAPKSLTMAVFRIESSLKQPARLTQQQINSVLSAILSYLAISGARALQIDFDAKVSERDFYQQMIEGLRAKLGAEFFISITALCSWCQYDNWLNSLAVDEVVPLFFRLGPDRNYFRDLLQSGTGLRQQKCRKSLGVSLDESIHVATVPIRTYYFNPRAWNRQSIESIIVK